MTEQQAEASFDLSASPSHLLHRAQQSAVNLSSSALAEQGLTLRQFAVLAALASEEGQSQSRLVDKTGIDRSTLADMVGRMERAGYIKRTDSKEDRRAKTVSLLAKGRKAYEAALPAVEAADKQVLDMIRANRRVGFLASLASIGGPEEEAEVLEDMAAAESEDADKSKAKPKKAKTAKAAKADKADKSKTDKKKKKKKKKK
ncbi:MarR family winged helix-turn-helix transcriptional regulator [Henriciella mobilis]|uniref:MarR family transcriptional regulator n=1 Tax=Henriciella mobilis TaxID=2305467 RepID=A0A399RM61_9PROT|nr:MarR family transcriptional regulator [Henriciella mobilis]RIJ17594.1 MarR family transcriptional regulator [Henriciella mobilis]RIJ25744.1 MarR family transcriptional regulator [Henriciella mobilis]RIJ30795.1 MarR family transcriptional regulator [Henriciella mobilis]